MQKFSARRHALLGAAALGAMVPAMVSAQEVPTESTDRPVVVATDGLNPRADPPGGLQDSTVNLTGVGQMRTISNLTLRVGGLCTGTLINPRTVIFAAHCVNSQAASAYGAATGGTPISFGFNSDNLVARRLWAGLSADGLTINPITSDTFKTNVANNIFSVEQVWYDTRSLIAPRRGFLENDVAIATLDTPASEIPTWAMLLTPLTGPTHALVNGYGQTSSTTTGGTTGIIRSGPGASPLDSRRRVAENVVSFLGSSADLNNTLFCTILERCAPNTFQTLPQAVYQTDFDSPNLSGQFDFDVFQGAALAREGTTAPGDSGGPLIVDQKFNQKVIAGVLSYGSTFFNGQRESTFGSTSGYQPLFLFWDLIVQNNPYVYASAKAGSGSWFDPSRWIQDMDPSYQVERDGQLVNALPGELGREGSLNTTRFGTVCFLTDCRTIDNGVVQDAGTGAGLVITGGPGSTNFVPNNVVADRIMGVRARYYDVTLRNSGSTTLDRAATIDKLTIDGPALLDVAATGSLRVLGDFNNLAGATHVDGLLKAGETFFLTGLLSGNGTLDPTVLTSVAAVIAPGSLNGTGTLTIQGDVVLASASVLVLDVNRDRQDKLVILGDAQNTGQILLGGTVFFQKNGAAPRHGQSFDIVTAAGGVNGMFDNVGTLQGVGVLRPELAYGSNAVTVNIRAGSVAEYLGGNGGGSAVAFAKALDVLRASSYNNLSNLYGAVDLMAPGELAFTLNSLAPRVLDESGLLQDRQSRMLMANITDRLALAGTGAAQGLTVIGDTRGFTGEVSGALAGRQAFAGLAPATRAPGRLPEGVTGFIAAGTSTGESSYGSSARLGGGRSGSWMGMGLEFRAGDRTTIGTATGFASATSQPGSDRVDSRTLQVAAYATRELGGGAYLGAVVNMESAHLDSDRTGFGGTSLLELTGATDMRRIGMMAEAGKAFALGGGLSFTPRVRLGYDRQVIEGFQERGGETALAIDSFSRERVEAKLGFALAGSTKLGNGWRLAPQVQADVSRRLAGTGGDLTVRFANAPEAGIVLPLTGTARTWAEARAAISLDNGVVAFSAGGETAFGAGYRDDRAIAGLTVRF